MELSIEARYIVLHMVSHLLDLKYADRIFVEKSYDNAIKKYGMDEPKEDRRLIINFVIWKLNYIYNSEDKYGPGY